MAEVTCTNRKVSPAFKGSAIICTLNAADALTILPQLAVGQIGTLGSSTAECRVSFVDSPGHSFKAVPVRPEQSLGTGTAPETAKNTFDINDDIVITV